MAKRGLTAGLLAVWLGAPALAAEPVSAYTKIDLNACDRAPVDADDPYAGGVWWCDGFAGVAVRVAEGDLRFFVSYGPNAAEEIAAAQTLPPFNTIGETIEWRMAPAADGRLLPFATILRFHTESEDDRGQVLVVTKLGGRGQVCHVGTIDALLNPDANVLARDVADNAAPGFDCRRDRPLAYGQVGDDARS